MLPLTENVGGTVIMNWNAIFENIIASSLVSGIIVFFLQQWIQIKLKQLENKIAEKREYKQKSAEYLATSYKQIWKTLIEMDKLFKVDLVKFIETEGIVKSFPKIEQTIQTGHFSLRAEMLFLPDDLYDQTNQAILDAINNFNEMVVKITSIVSRADSENRSEALAAVNNELNKMSQNYSKSIDELRKKYQLISRDILFDDISTLKS